MFPLSTVLYPYAGLPLQVFETRYVALLADCLEGDRQFGVVLISRGSEVGGGDQRVEVGTLARIAQVSPLPDRRFSVMAVGVRRIRVTEWLDDDPYPRALVEDLPAEALAGDDDVLAGAHLSVRRVRSLLSELGRVPAIPHDLDLGSEPDQVAWRLCALAPLNLIDSQRLLLVDDGADRLRLLTELCDALAQDVTGMLAGGHEA